LKHTHLFIYFCAQEAQRAAKAKQLGGQKQKETSAVKEEPKKLQFAKVQTSGSNITNTKSDCASVTGMLL